MAFAVIRIRYISAAFILFAFLTSHVGAVEFDLRSIGDLNNPESELTIEQYRRQLEEYMTNNQLMDNNHGLADDDDGA